MRDPLLPGRALRILAALGCAVMIAMFVYGALNGYAWSQLTAIASIAWGQVLLADLYLGFALFAAWMIWRDGTGLVTAIWVVALLVLGNVVACIYVLRALYQGRTDGRFFWHGLRAARESPGGA